MRFGSLLVTLGVPLIAIMLNIWLIASRPFLRWEYSRPTFPAAEGFSAAERMQLAVPSTLFLVRPITRGELEALRHDGRPLYERDEIDHLEDVRRLVGQLTWLGLMSVAWLLVGAYRWRRGLFPGWPGALVRGAGLTVGIVAVVGLAMGVAWPVVFTGFHELFFKPGTWSFPIESGLIRLFPGQFWYDVAVLMAGLAAAEGLAAVALGRWLSRSRRA